MSDTSLLADALASADEKDQAAFFNAFFRDLYARCRSNSSNGRTQIGWITRWLDSFSRDAIKDWAADCEYQNEQDQVRRAEFTVDEHTAWRLKTEIAELEKRKRALEEECA